MAAVFDAPVAPVGSQQSLGIGWFRGPAGDARAYIAGALSAFFICELTFDDKGLSNMRKAQVAVECGGGPDFADFDASMVTADGIDEIGLLAVVEVQLDVFK